MAKVKYIDKYSTLFAHPKGYHYHLSKSCGMLADFEKEGYEKITFTDIKNRRLVPCPSCAYEKNGRKTL